MFDFCAELILGPSISVWTQKLSRYGNGSLCVGTHLYPSLLHSSTKISRPSATVLPGNLQSTSPS